MTDLESVSCPSAKNCIAVGFARVANSYKALVEHWNGSRWAVVPGANPAGSTGAYLYGVSCPGASSCFAVGGFTRGSVFNSLVEHWDGISWSIMPSPNFADSRKSFLYGVACASTTTCFAVSYQHATSGNALMQQYDGSNWSVVTIPKPSGSSENSPFAVSCPSATGCFAVGYSQPFVEAPLRTAVEHWDGSSWTIVPSPNPNNATTGLAGVSCPSATSCFAVGAYASKTAQGNKGLVERWDGSAWSVVASPNPAGSRNINLAASVVCERFQLLHSRLLFPRHRREDAG